MPERPRRPCENRLHGERRPPPATPAARLGAAGRAASPSAVRRVSFSRRTRAQRDRVTTTARAGDASPGTVAAFDLDGTLTTGGSVVPFLVAVRGLLPVVGALLATLPRLASAAVAGGSRADSAKESLFIRLLGGLPARRVDQVAASFAERHLRRRLRADALARLEWHRSEGHAVVLVSASPECYVRRIGELLEVDGVVATRLAVDAAGLLTGRYEGKNCRGAEKYARTMTWLRTSSLAGNGRPQPVLWAYGNSRGDLRLLDAADHGVNAGRLGRLGRLRRYPSLAAVAGGSATARTAEPVTRGTPPRPPRGPRSSRRTS